MDDNKNMQNLYEVRKTVRFGLQTFEKTNSKNLNYNNVVKSLQKNEYLKGEIDKLSNRFIISSNKGEWFDFINSIKEKLKTISEYIEKYSNIFIEIGGIEKKYYFHINLNLNKLKGKGSFGKTLYYSYDENKINKEERKKKKIKIINKVGLFSNINDKDSFKKHFENDLEDFEKCKSIFDIYNLFIQIRINLLNKNIDEVEKLLKNENHNKERLSEIYKEINYIYKNIMILNDYLFGIIVFSGGLAKETNSVKNEINSLEQEKSYIENILLEMLDYIKDPNNGYEIGKATLHYNTLNKKSDIDAEIENYKKLLGFENDNKLSEFGKEMVELLYKEKDNIESQSSLIEKIKYTIELCKNITKYENITLYDVVNYLNNKNQIYDKFIIENQNFSELGIKQRLRFALTTLVDCEIYKPKNFLKRCLEIEEDAKQVLKDFGFKDKDYEEYKNYTFEISKEINIKDNTKKRGYLFKNSNIYNKAFTLNSIVSGLKGALEAYIDFLEKEKVEQEKLQFYGVLGIHNNDKILLLIDKKESQNFHNYIENKENHKGNSFIYLYNSITIKSLKKLFNQIYSKNHPFSFSKKNIFEKRNLKSIDELKFDDLHFEEIKKLFLSTNENDIGKYENWKEKFKKIYEKIDGCKTKEELFEIIETKGIYFEKVSIDIETLKNKFTNLIISFVKNGTEKDFKNIHLEYFEKAIERMQKGKDIKEKLNPEILVSYVPVTNEIEQKKTIEFYKNKTYSKPGAKFNLEFLENNHRFWRENINVGFTIEFNLPTKENSKKDFRMIGIDRGEKKLATLCNLEYKNGEISILPIKYYENDENDEEKYKYFLDLANFKIGVFNGKKRIIKVYKEDNNINLKKYEYLLRLQRTLWLKENYGKVEKIFNDLKGNEDILLKIENNFFDIDGLKKYRKEIFKDEDFKNQIIYLLEFWKDFNKKEIPTNEEEKNIWFEKKQIMEVNKIKMRENIASNITGIIDFLINENAENGLDTYISMENLHNSGWDNKFIIDKIDGTKKINNDFVEYRHNKLFGTTTYNKIEQSILNKLQVHKNLENYYENQSIKGEKTNYIKKIQNELKFVSKKENKEKQKDFYEKEVSLTHAKIYGNIIFVDPYYTSKKCPQCGVFGEDKVKGHNTDLDIIYCEECTFHGENAIQGGKEKVKFKNNGIIEIHKVVKTGDENGTLQIGLRGIKEIEI